jgi:DnaJ domain
LTFEEHFAIFHWRSKWLCFFRYQRYSDMGLDYYAILDVGREVTRVDIILAYRKLAIRTHPIRMEAAGNEAVELPLPTMGGKMYWRLLNEAFDVLCKCFSGAESKRT